MYLPKHSLLLQQMSTWKPSSEVLNKTKQLILRVMLKIRSGDWFMGNEDASLNNEEVVDYEDLIAKLVFA